MLSVALNILGVSLKGHSLQKQGSAGFLIRGGK